MVVAASSRTYEVDRSLTVAVGTAGKVPVPDHNMTWYINISSSIAVDIYILPPGFDTSTTDAAILKAASARYWESESVLKDVAFTPTSHRFGTFTIVIVDRGGVNASVRIQVDTTYEESTPTWCLVGFWVCVGSICSVGIAVLVAAVAAIVVTARKISQKKRTMESNWASGAAKPGGRLPPVGGGLQAPRVTPSPPVYPGRGALPPPGAPPRSQVSGMQLRPSSGSPGPSVPSGSLFHENFYRIDRKIISLASRYTIYDASDRPLAWSYMKMFTLKEDIRIFADEGLTRPSVLIKQQQILDLSGTFAIIDLATGEVMGYVKRDAISSFISDRWEILSPSGIALGYVSESNIILALARRFTRIGKFIPDSLDVSMGNVMVASITEKFRVIGNEFTITVHDTPLRPLDRQMAVALVLLMAIFEQLRQ